MGSTPTVGKSARLQGVATIALMALSLALVFFYAPLEAEQGFLQKIFYVHVPLAIISLVAFVLAGLLAVQYLRTRDAVWDMRAWVMIDLALAFAVAALVCGSIWAKGSWGHWWVWNEPTLVSFLIVILFYAVYRPLRAAVEDRERQAAYASVYAIVGAVFVPLNFLAVRFSSAYLHPRVLGASSQLPGPMALTFLVCLAADALLFATMFRYEMSLRRLRAMVRALRRRREAARAAAALTEQRRSAA
ncbi:MAG TPA: cytochrome c biogenesis protein CcsA [Solirubrobacteraceae bacterium]|nr:cytochrome c biogenesis protein CcsA [Solirubrobacteraceae bacterium]